MIQRPGDYIRLDKRSKIAYFVAVKGVPIARDREAILARKAELRGEKRQKPWELPALEQALAEIDALP